MQWIQFVEEMGKRKFLSPYYLAEIHLGLNEVERALPLFESALALRMPQLFLLRMEPVFHQVPGERRLAALVARLQLYGA